MSESVIEKNKASKDQLSREEINNLKPLVLIADDHQDCREMLRILLETWNFCVIEAANGTEAVSLAERELPDLILLDAKMPLLDGFQTARRLRRTEKVADVPVLFISGCAEKYYREAAKEAGADEFLVKPLDLAELEKTIDKYVRRPQKSAPDLSRIFEKAG